MQHRKTLTASISCLILAAGAAQADTTTFTASDSNWNSSGNWDNGIPTEADRAVIPAGKICHVDITTAVADTISIASTGTLVIDANKKLTLDNDDDNTGQDPDHSGVAGTLTLAGSGSVLAFTENVHHVAGAGEINGGDNAAKITIAYDITFLSALSTIGITGDMVIQGLTDNAETEFGIFRNDGIVNANGSGILLLHEDTILADAPSAGYAIWKAYGGTLQFAREATDLDGDFILDGCGALDIDADIATCGEWTWDAGVIDLASSMDFEYASFSTSTSATNPGSAGGTGCINWQLLDGYWEMWNCKGP